MIVGETITPWLLGTFLLLGLMTAAVTIKSWREMKRSPYFFLRRQAEKRMQDYSITSLVLLLAAAATYGFAWQTPTDNTSRVAVLANTKPPKDEIVELVRENTPAAVAEIGVPEAILAAGAGETILDKPLLGDPSLLVEEGIDVTTEEAQALPEQFDQFEPTADLASRTNIGRLVFSTELTPNYEPINPSRVFAEGFYTLYATFDYQEMSNGLEWSWVWRHNGTTIDGGNELWNYGDSGLGYIFLSPEEGFDHGEYALEVWVNGEMLSQSSVIMNDAAVSAGN